MKKIKTSFALSFIIALLFAVTFIFVTPAKVSAADITAPGTANTSMTYDVASTYTVTIPETVTIGAEKTGTLTVGVGANALIAYDTSIQVVLSTCDFSLSNNDDTMDYTIEDGETSIVQGATILQHAAGTVEASSKELDVSVTGSPKYSGSYTDSITFTISVG